MTTLPQAAQEQHKLRAKLQKDIAQLVVDFGNATGLTVRDIDVELMKMCAGVREAVGIKVIVEL